MNNGRMALHPDESSHYAGSVKANRVFLGLRTKSFRPTLLLSINELKTKKTFPIGYGFNSFAWSLKTPQSVPTRLSLEVTRRAASSRKEITCSFSRGEIIESISKNGGWTGKQLNVAKSANYTLLADYEHPYPNSGTIIKALFQKHYVDIPTIYSSSRVASPRTQTDFMSQGFISQGDGMRSTKAETEAFNRAAGAVPSSANTPAVNSPSRGPSPPHQIDVCAQTELPGTRHGEEVINGTSVSPSGGYATLVDNSTNNGAGVFNKIAGTQTNYYNTTYCNYNTGSSPKLQ
ncbi:hypothetical protein EYR38_009813 [Pleurotus pulmonarius]|nr:hypothetical protein EYR38_009813 [Pleurotus pulmonarius]